MRAVALCCGALVVAQTLHLAAQGDERERLALLDVPFVSQSELLCGGAAAAMVLRYWGERQVSAETFAHLVDRSAAGIRADALIGDLRRRGWMAHGVLADEKVVRQELARGHPVLALIEDRPSVFHYVVVVAWHERGVVLHDPARAPFVVMSVGEFDRRWRAARYWMGVVVPGETMAGTDGQPPVTPSAETAEPRANGCAGIVAQGVRYAQANQFDEAERVLVGALDCPAAVRELAGLRVLQRRWPEAEDLASLAVTANGEDAYAWKVLATSRFVQDDQLGALSAWNRVGEPRVDLVRVDGLTRTRHRVVEQLVDAPAGELLTLSRFLRARRRLAMLPAATSTRLDYVPVAGGLAEVRAVVAERSLVPHDRFSLAAAGLVAAATRELRMTTGALFGRGEGAVAAWRFWPNRGRVGAGLEAPAPWGGVWSVAASSERQPFSAVELRAAERVSARIAVSDWFGPRGRWTVRSGLDQWSAEGTAAHVGGGVQVASLGDRVVAAFDVSGWPGERSFATFDAGVSARSAVRRQGVVVRGAANLQFATDLTPLDLWWAGDTGHARSALLRAHPLLEDGALRADRLGRSLAQAGVEAQRWWSAGGPISLAAAVFVDLGRTGRRYTGPARGDVDIGIGARVGISGISGAFRADVAKGLADGATAISVTYEP